MSIEGWFLLDPRIPTLDHGLALLSIPSKRASAFFSSLLGILAPGLNLANAELPRCHLTALGEATISRASRDPANPTGYLRALRSRGPIPPIADSYIEEAIATYNTMCFKASAVMVGAASEVLLLRLRDVVVERLVVNGRTPNARLLDWRAKTVMDGLADELGNHLKVMSTRLRDAFQYTWPAFLQHIRAGRNDAGHPSSIAPISQESVHASLLIFPELLTLSADLETWVASSMP